MCYEFSEWFTRARALEKTRKEQPTTEQVKQRQPAPEPVAPDTRVKQREPAPA